jgi:hypothetical protein
MANPQNNSQDKIILSLRMPKDAEQTPESAAQLFSSLKSFARPSIFTKIFGSQQSLTFEIVVCQQTIYFLAVTPQSFANFLESQLIAQYPQMVIAPVGDYLDPWLHNTHKTYGQLVLSSSSYYPLRTYEDFKDIDPLSSVLGTMAKANPNELMLFQLLVAPTDSSWQTKALKAVEKGITLSTSDGRFQTRSLPHANIIEKKASLPGFKTGLRLLVCSQNKETSEKLLINLAGSFGSFSLGEGNTLILKKPLSIQKSSFEKSILNRTFKFIPRHQILNVAEIATLFHLPSEKLSRLKNIAWGRSLLGESPENLPIAADLTDEQKKEINFFARTEYKNKITTFGIKRKDRRKHIYIIGKTGTGKSTLIANMAINDIRHGEGVAVIDPHGDLCEILLNYIPSYRLNDICYLDPSDVKFPFRLNTLEVKNPAHAELIASGIVSIFYKLYSYSWGPRLEYILRNTIMTLVNRPGSTLVDVPRILADDNFRQKVVDKIQDEVLKNFWLNEFNKMSEKLRSEAIAPVLNKVGQFVTSPLIRNIIGYPHSTIDLEEFMDQGKILIANFSQGKLGEDNATLLGAMFITQMQLASMNRVNFPEEQRKDFYLYVDEFQNFATASFIKILSEARKYRLNITVANQYIAQIPEDIQKAIFGNVGTLVSFLVGAQDSYVLSKEFGGTYKEEDLVGLGNYQIVNKLSIDNLTSTPFYGFTLPLPRCVNKNRPKVISLSRERYTKPIES